MAAGRTKLWILLCGIAVSTATPLCHAQDAGMPSEVKKPQTAVSPALFPVTVNTPSPMPAQENPAKGASETSWYWRILGWLAMDIARYNTEKQSDGRPNPLGNSR